MTAATLDVRVLDDCVIRLPDGRSLLQGFALGLGAVATVAAAIATVTVAAGWIASVALLAHPNAPYAKAKPGLRSLALADSAPMLLAAPADGLPHVVIISTPETTRDVADVAEPPARPTAEAPAVRFNPPLPPRRIAATPPLPPARPAIPEVASAPATFEVADAGPLSLPAQQNEQKPMQKQAALPPIKKPSALPAAGSRTAIYDISAHTVYLPNGRRLEAHSGVGERMDDPRYVKVKMRGPTPPNVYRLTLREQLFHGVRAIRLNPVDENRMFGRAGMLAHTYMLGPSGQSNGCVSFKNYRAFLQAYLDGEIDRLVVVPRISDAPATLVSALQGRGERMAMSDSENYPSAIGAVH